MASAVLAVIQSRPGILMVFGQDHGHSRVHLGKQFVRFAGNDRAGAEPIVGRRIFPGFPEPGENEWSIIFHPNRVGNLSAGDFLPFVEAVSRNQAAPLFKRFAVARRGINGFDSALIVLKPILASLAQ